MMNACCCISLQRGVIIMAVIDMVFAAINAGLWVMALIFVVGDIGDGRYENEGATTARVIISVIIAILGLLLSIRLYFGAKRKDIRNCKIWLIVKIILFIIDVVLIIVSLVTSDGDELNYAFYVTIGIMIYQLYMMFCVFCFIKQLGREQASSGTHNGVQVEQGYAMATYPGNGQTQIYVSTTPYPATTGYGYPPQQQQAYSQQPPPAYPYGWNGQGQTQTTGISNPHSQYHASTNANNNS